MDDVPCPECGKGLIQRMRGGTGVGDEVGRIYSQRGRYGYCDVCGAGYEPDEQGAWRPVGEEWRVEILVREQGEPTDWVPLGKVTGVDLQAHRELVADFARRGVPEPTERLHRLRDAGV